MRSLERSRFAAAGRKSGDRSRRPAVDARPAPAARRAPAAARGAGGLPEKLQAVMEAMSGFSLADVVVHRDSAEPARLGALAFTKGSQIHLAPGQERHLPHEAWHVVQQKQGRVQPTLQRKAGVQINDDLGLEREADAMGARALLPAGAGPCTLAPREPLRHSGAAMPIVQRLSYEVLETGQYYKVAGYDHVLYLRAKRKVGVNAFTPHAEVKRPTIEITDLDAIERKASPEEIATASARMALLTDGGAQDSRGRPPTSSAAAAGSTGNPQNRASGSTRFLQGAGGTVLARSPSFDSVDSEGETYHVKGSLEHKKLAAGAEKAERTKDTQNIVSASLTVVYKMAGGESDQSTGGMRSMWNSGYFQHLLESEAEAASGDEAEVEGDESPAVDFQHAQRAMVEKFLPTKKFQASAHSHSEVSMAADPELAAKLETAYENLIEPLPKHVTILKIVIRVHSSPNTVCMNACRAALADVRLQAESLRKISERQGFRLSGRFAVELMATSDAPFMKLAGNKPHALLASGTPGDEAPARADAGRVIEVLNDKSRAELEKSAASSSSSRPSGKK